MRKAFYPESEAWKRQVERVAVDTLPAFAGCGGAIGISVTAHLIGPGASKVPSEPISALSPKFWHNNHAKEVCPRVARQWRGAWTGHWKTTVSGEMSVCQLSF